MDGMLAGSMAGRARGTVELDISQLEAAVRAAQQLGRSFEQALGGVDRSVKQTTTSFRTLVDGISSLRGELLAVSAATGLATRSGLTGARNLRNYTIAFRQFVNSQEEAVELTNRLIEQANRYGLVWEGVVQLGRAILPSLKEGVDDLDDWIGRAARLRSLFPAAPVGSETFAIAEFLADQDVSLARRFNVPLSLINEAREKFDDVGKAFDYILDKRGATEAAAIAMADSFVGVRNELKLLLAEGFTPLFQQLQPILSTFREWVSSVRESNPEVATLSAGFIAATAAGTPLLLLFNQLVIAAEKLKSLGILSSLGRAGVYGAAAYVGGNVGLGISRQIGELRGDEQQANATWADIWQTIKEMNYLSVWSYTKLSQLLYDSVAFIDSEWRKMMASLYSGLSGFLRAIAAWLPAGAGGAVMMRAADRADANIAEESARGQQSLANAEAYRQRSEKWLMDYAAAVQAGGGGGVIDKLLGVGPQNNDGSGRTPDQTAAITQWAQSVRQIERQAAEQRLEATRQYEQQRTDMIANYERNIAREAEDFARQRARQREEFERQLEEVSEAARRREAKWLEDLNEKIADVQADRDKKIADLTEDANAHLLELQEKYQRDREQAAEDHRERLLTAAGRLDAVAVREEQRRFMLENRQAKENFDERVESERKSLAERIQQERENAAERIHQDREAHQERLEDAREADALRIQDMRENLAEQQRLEDEERTLRLQRQAEDHARQLAQQAAANAERLAQIDQQAALERKQIDEQFQIQLASLGIYNKAWLTIQQAREDASLKMFDQWWAAVNQRFVMQGPTGAQWLSDFAGGLSQPPATLPAQQNGFPKSFADAASRAVWRTVSINNLGIEVYGAPGQSEEELGRVVERKFLQMLEEVQY